MPIMTYGPNVGRAGGVQTLIRPSSPGRNCYPLIYTHGAGGNGAMNNYGNQDLRAVAMADRYGATAVQTDAGGAQTWGNKTAMAAITGEYNFLQTFTDVKGGKVAISGGSMGGLNALVWASQNITKVAALSIYIPVINVTDIWANDRGGFRATIDQCWGGWDPDRWDAIGNPLVIAKSGVYNNLPILINYGINDPLCLRQFTEQFASIVGSNVILRPRNGGHDLATEGSIDREEEIAFLASYIA